MGEFQVPSTTRGAPPCRGGPRRGPRHEQPIAPLPRPDQTFHARPMAASTTAYRSTSRASTATHVRPASASTDAWWLLRAALTSAAACGPNALGRDARIPAWIPAQWKGGPQATPPRLATIAVPAPPHRSGEFALVKACGGDPEFGHRKDVPQVDRRGHEDRSSLPPQRTETGQVVPTSRASRPSRRAHHHTSSRGLSRSVRARLSSTRW